MRKPAEIWARISGEEMDKLTIRELEDEKFLDRDAFDSSLSRIEAASLMATKRGNRLLALADAVHAKNKKGLYKDDEIEILKSQMSEEDIKDGIALASWWSQD